MNNWNILFWNIFVSFALSCVNKTTFFFFSVEDKKTYSRKGLVVLSLFSWAEFQFMIEWRWGKPFCKRCIKQIEALVIWYACSIRFSNKIINYSCCKSQSGRLWWWMIDKPVATIDDVYMKCFIMFHSWKKNKNHCKYRNLFND